jgi:hypothetical protein
MLDPPPPAPTFSTVRLPNPLELQTHETCRLLWLGMCMCTVATRKAASRKCLFPCGFWYSRRKFGGGRRRRVRNFQCCGGVRGVRRRVTTTFEVLPVPCAFRWVRPCLTTTCGILPVPCGVPKGSQVVDHRSWSPPVLDHHLRNPSGAWTVSLLVSHNPQATARILVRILDL